MDTPLNSNWTHEAAAEGMARAARGANPEWWRYMMELIIEVARRKPYLYTDDIERLRRERKGPETHEQRAMGPLMKWAKDAGIIARTHHLVPGRWDKRVWFSLIYRGPDRPRRPRRLRIIDPRQYEMLQL
jgi:hypothetical protein